jgi:hypothetical protein
MKHAPLPTDSELDAFGRDMGATLTHAHRVVGGNVTVNSSTTR